MATDVSTLALAKAAYLSSAGWFEDGSVTLAKQHVTAANALLLLLPNSSVKGSNQVGYSKSEIAESRDKAQAYALANAATAGATVRADLRSFRQ